MRLMTSRDLLRFHLISDPRLSPDGRSVAWVRRGIIAAENRYHSAIFVTDVATGESRRLTAEGEVHTFPRWAPDGKTIAYVGSGQLWLIPAEGGTRRCLTDVSGGVKDPTWSPDGTRLAFTTMVEPSRGLELASAVAAAEPTDLYEKYNADVLVVRRLGWKQDGVGFTVYKRSHVAIVSVAGGDTRLVTCSDKDFEGPRWSPDGSRIAFTGNPDADATRKGTVYVMPGDSPGIAEPQALIELNLLHPNFSWSPDGNTLAVQGHRTPKVEHYGNLYLWLVPASGGEAICLTKDFDYCLADASRDSDMRAGGDDSPQWLPDGSALYVLANINGDVHLHQVDRESGKITPVTTGQDRSITAFTVDAAAKTMVGIVCEDTLPCDLFTISWNGKSPAALRRLTEVNGELLGEIQLPKPERFSFESDGQTVIGWVIPPTNQIPGKKYPAILFNGGGPRGMRTGLFSHQRFLLSAQGYAVMHCNARGNHGHGEAFSVAVRGRWGDGDYVDNMNFVKALCASKDYIDPDRLGAMGGSYGGYSSVWQIAHTDIFKAAISMNMLFNRFSFNGTSDMGYLLDQAEFEGRHPWDDPQTYLHRSPMSHVGRIKTPCLVMHSGDDHRCPFEQGEQFYMALKRLNVPTEFVIIQNEGHGVVQPWHRVRRLDIVAEWMDGWLQPQEA